MRMPKPRNDKRGVSPIIATLLLIVIAVAAAVVTYTFVMGFVGTATQSTGAQGQLNYDSYKVSGTTDANITAYIRNSGGRTVTLSAVYVDGTPYTWNGVANSTNYTSVIDSGSWSFIVDTGNATQILDINKIGTLYINTQDLNAAQWHTVRIVCEDGTTLEFSVRK